MTHTKNRDEAASQPQTTTRGWVKVTAMVVGFTVVMAVSSSIASAMSHPVASLVVGPVLAALVLVLYSVAVRRTEHRPVTELALPGAASAVRRGAAGGFALATITITVLALFGGYRITGWGSLSGALTVVGLMCAVAVAEEVLFRGVVFRLLQQRWGTWLALGASALLFGFVHLVNPGATLWGAVAIAIEAGLMLGAAYVATGSLWLPIGLHLGWNITSVAVFGTIASGSDARESLATAITPGPVWLTGGTFGPEASIVAVLVCSVATVLLVRLAQRRGRIVPMRRG
ncbi:CPBP family intramembrane glutamic endopeptidase [Sanguibacter antarcticus]|uniref:CAAX prenyl protease 2/Lysostaphin resistance protein A-like domain-containing protein n=1 Tax=Sanguibacter antarcticus TaxID=372484 RepID=A0A2A9E7J8_9MICO|nr:type II CAAX endopeptidase family protein [Sanguibacter antarcticus]PFG34834.1 hypothetical protein ATL42_2762 [Sanguibacter antarcticus]